MTKKLIMFSFSVQSRPWMMENPERWIQKRKQTNPREAEQGQHSRLSMQR